MTLIAIIICLLLEMFWQRLSAFRNYAWFPSYIGALQERFGGKEWWHGPAGVSLALLILLLPVILVHALVDDVWLGLPELLFGIVVLAASLRFQPLDRMIDGYMDAVDSSETGAITDAAQAIYADSVGGAAVADYAEEGGHHVRDVTRAVLVFSNERMFAVLFWFVLLGPLGAVLYRGTCMLTRHVRVPAEHELPQPVGFALSARRLLQIMDWAPSRLLALTYGVSGSFEDALQEWQKYYADASKPSLELSEDILAHAGCGALHVSRYEKSSAGSEDDDEGTELEPEVVTSARGLVLRSLVTWCIVLALVTLSGWVA